MRLRNVKQKQFIMDNSSYFVGDFQQYIGKWQTAFLKRQPLYIEIGMGKGQFIIENAKKYPNINFIGIEKYDSIVARALQKIPEGLDNLKIVRMDALMIDEAFHKEVSRIYLNFSDPWPKKRHSLRRLTSSVFLQKYDSIFKDKKEIYMKTDNRDLFTYSLESFSEHGYILRDIHLNLHENMQEEIITTEYEDKFSSKGCPIYSVIATDK